MENVSAGTVASLQSNADKPGASRQVIASLQVFLGGASYGVMATTYKLAYAAGFTSNQVVAGQAWLALALFVLLVLANRARGERLAKLGAKTVLKLMGLGMLTCTTSILYCYAMSVLPAPVALTLLFQFTWVGLVIQAIATRRAPHACHIIAAGVIMAGTIFASGLYGTDLGSLDPVGIVCALGASVSCALFVTLSGKVPADCPPAQRGTIVVAGSALLSLAACPSFLPSGVLFQGFAPYAAIAALFALVFPVILFGLGAPHLPSGLCTILSAAELPMGLLVSMNVLGTPMGALEWAGVATVLAGVVIAQLPSFASRGAQRSRAYPPNAPISSGTKSK